MIIYGLTDTGMCRTENQDCFSFAAVSSFWGKRKRKQDALLAVVCDGMGGASGGNVASHLAADSFLHTFSQELSCESQDALQAALQTANEKIRQAAAEDPALHGMGTTVVSALVCEKRISLLHVGDSRAYLWHKGVLSCLTRDHSYVQQMIDEGKMTEEEARHSRYKNLITRAVGTASSVKGDTLSLPWQDGDKLLLCTDGLIGFVDEREMCSILSEDIFAEQAVHELIGAANSRGCDDNLTALLLVNKKGE